MALNYIWIAFFLVGFIVALGQLIFSGNTEIFNDLVNSIFLNAKTGFEISLGLTGALTLWMGLLKVGEKGGIINILGRIMAPFFQKLFPGLPKGHPAYGSITLNIAANMLGLDNAATPVGLKAMKEMQETNPDKETASNAQIMFLGSQCCRTYNNPGKYYCLQNAAWRCQSCRYFHPYPYINLFCLINRYDKCGNHSEDQSFR